ncbi:MAG: archaellin/type IV pilin N-terminal domain-containing protein [Promethearchaeota archaeon]
MKSLIRLTNKKRAISPVIAVILLIGLAVAAAAAIFIVVLPLFQPSSNLQMDGAYVIYDDEYTTAADLGEGFGKITLVLSNTGTADIDIVSVKVYYASDLLGLGSGTEIINHTGTLISENNPYTLDTLTSLKELSVRFPIPDENDDNTVFYRTVITTGEGEELDTATEENVEETEMDLSADRPEIRYSGSELGFLRRVAPIRPSRVSDNSEIKKVTYEIFHEDETPIPEKTKTIKPPNTLWQWSWDTWNDTTEGLDNGSYKMKMTVYDYAGLSNETALLNFTIDNDYIKPKISNIMGASDKNGLNTAEVGASYEINATITDSGCGVSAVKTAYIYYKLNDSSTTYLAAGGKMTDPDEDDIWVGNIPADFIDSNALANNLTFYIEADDNDDNSNTSENHEAGVLDTTKPDMSEHTPILEVTETEEGPPPITLSVKVTDYDTVDLVTLVWREGNDTGLLIPDPWEVSNYVEQTDDTWYFTIPAINVTVDGLDYYINATDPSGNTNDGSASSPYHIDVLDGAIPTTWFDPKLTSPTVPGQPVSVRVAVEDNDLSFSTERYISETGTVKLSFSIDGGSFSTPDDMTHTSGDSSLGKHVEGIWQGTIAGGNVQEESTLTVRVESTDQSFQTTAIQTDVTVSAAGEPLFRVSGTANTTGTYDHKIEVDIENYGAGDSEITNMTVYLYDNTKLSYIGSPLLTQINATGISIFGTNPRWENTSTPSEFTNGTEKNLNNIIAIDSGETAELLLTYANSSGGYFDVNDMTVGIIFGYTYGVASSGYSGNMKANTTITAYQTDTQTRYMRSDSHNVNGWGAYNLGTTQSSSVLSLNERTGRGTGSLTVTWSVWIYVVHSDSTRTDLTSGKVASVSRSIDGSGLQSKTWTLGSNQDITTTDAVMVEVYMDIGPYGYGPVTFITEQLNAEELVASTWTIWYYTERDYTGWPQDRTRGIFYWGDSTYNSRIVNFKISTITGGGGASTPLIKVFSPENDPLSHNEPLNRQVIPMTRIFSPLSLFSEKLVTNLLNKDFLSPRIKY